MPPVKDVGEPGAGEPHARFDGGREETSASRLLPCGVRRLPPTRPTSEYARSSLTFEDLLNEDYPKGIWVEPQYRRAILDLEQTEGVPLWVVRGRTTPSGRAPRGLKLGDVVRFG